MPSASDLRLENAVVRKLENKPPIEVVSTPKQDVYTILQSTIDEIEAEETDDKQLKLKDFRAVQTLKNARTNLMIRFLFDEVCRLKQLINKK
jgi:hypothetical protein